MTKTIYISVIAILLNLVSNGQENRISFSTGYPINKTKHWLVDEWENSINFGLSYKHVDNLWIYGVGLDFSNYNISWFKNYYSGNHTVSNLNPHVLFGLNINNGLLYAIPHVDLGYSFILTNIEIWDGNKGGIYSGAGVDFNVNIKEGIMIGLGTNYNIIFSKMDFTDSSYPQDLIPFEDEFMKSWLLNFNIVFRL